MRFQQQWAEESGAFVLTETAASQLLVADGRVLGVRSGDEGGGEDCEQPKNFETGADWPPVCAMSRAISWLPSAAMSATATATLQPRVRRQAP